MSGYLSRAAGCACQHAGPMSPTTHHVQGDIMADYSQFPENRWMPLAVSGADQITSIPCRVVWLQQGNHLHAYAKFRVPSGEVLMAHATTDLAHMEAEITQGIRERLALEAPNGAAAGGWFKRRMRKLKNRIKRFAKKSGIVKVLKTVHSVVNKALDNPIVQAALASNPYGAAFLAARKAVKVAVSAVKGSLKSRGVLKKMLKLATGGNLKARNFLRLVKNGVKNNAQIFKRLPQLAKFSQAAAAGASEMEQLAALVQGCTGYQPVTSSGAYSLVGADTDILGEPTDQELDALEGFAVSGAWEGVRWLASRMSLHSMAQRPDEYSKRDALLDGRALGANRFAFARV